MKQAKGKRVTPNENYRKSLSMRFSRRALSNNQLVTLITSLFYLYNGVNRGR